MEYYQVTQNRTGQTVAVIKAFAPGLSVAGVNADGLAAQAAPTCPARWASRPCCKAARTICTSC